MDESPGSWKGFYVNSQANSASTMKYVHFFYGGTEDGANLNINPAITVENCKFESSQGYGIKLSGDGAKEDYSGNGNTFSGNAKGEIDGALAR